MAKQDIFQFVLVESGKNAFNGIASKGANTMYAIPETNELYFGSELIADKNLSISTAIPVEAGRSEMIYIVTAGDDRGVYYYDTVDSAYKAIMSYSDFLTATGEATLTNKTIDADLNTISNLTLSNVKDGVVKTAIADKDNASDTNLATEKAIRTELDKKVNAEEGKSLISNAEIERLAGVDNYTHPSLPADVEEGKAYNKVTFDATGHVKTATAETTIAGLGITDVYTKDEVNSAINDAIQDLEWKESVATFDDIATTYPTPEEGWTVSVQDTNKVYRYDSKSSTWENIFSTATNLVEASVDGVGGHAGLMSANQAEKLGKVNVDAEVNQNAFSKVVVGSAELSASSKTDSFEIAEGDNITIQATTAENGKKVITISGSSGYTHPSLAEGVEEGTAYNKVTFDATGHVKTATAETTLAGLGVTVDASEIVSKDYKIATVDADIEKTDSVDVALGKLEYRVKTINTNLGNVITSNEISTSLSSDSTDQEVVSAKAVYNALAVTRI